jgi:hypothetical protein
VAPAASAILPEATQFGLIETRQPGREAGYPGGRDRTGAEIAV